VSPPSLLVRRAALDDARAIATIHVHAWQAAYRGIVPAAFLASLSVDEREGRWRKNLAEAGAATLVALDGPEMVGWASVGACRDPDGTPALGELWAIYVTPSRWHGGVGRALWRHGQAHLESTGHQEAVVWVLEDNGQARHFYESVGFAAAPDRAKTVEIGGAALREVRLRCAFQPWA
jgi:ribosomal protein S18 acetylase RimI-like enzyme